MFSISQVISLNCSCRDRSLFLISLRSNRSHVHVQLHPNPKSSKMAMPGDMLTEPTEKLVFNAPFIDKYKLPFRICNDGSRTVGWAIKTNCPARISADPPCGVLDPKAKAMLYVTCEPFDYSSTDVSVDRITIEWVLTPDNAGKQFKREWFQGDVITRRKNVPVNYNH